MDSSTYHSASLRHIKQWFSTLPIPNAEMRRGFFRASFIGPFWYRWSGFPSVHIAGLRHWQGKKFLSPNTATNILRHGDGVVQAFAMTVEAGTSMIDGKQGVALCYGAQGPRPWRWVRDELRAVDERTLLGMTLVDLPLLRHFYFPFLLVREP